jgi:hypothetical protein
VVTTATDAEGQKGVGTKLEMGRRGEVVKRNITARQVSLLSKYDNSLLILNTNRTHN